jgi:hypothetical protein
MFEYRRVTGNGIYISDNWGYLIDKRTSG